MTQHKRKEITSSIQRIFRTDSTPQPEISPELRQNILAEQQQQHHQREFAVELARNVLALFSNYTGGKYGKAGNLTAIPYWKGGEEPYILNLIPASTDDETGQIIKETIDLEMQGDLVAFWGELATIGSEKHPIIFDAGESVFTSFRLMATKPEALAHLLADYIETKNLGSLDRLQHHLRGDDVYFKNTLGTFNEVAQNTGRPMEQIAAERFFMVAPGAVYGSPEEAILDGELSRQMLFDHRDEIVDVSLARLTYLGARARGAVVPDEARGYVLH